MTDHNSLISARTNSLVANSEGNSLYYSDLIASFLSTILASALTSMALAKISAWRDGICNPVVYILCK